MRLGVLAVFGATALAGTVLAATRVELTRRSTSEAILKKSHPLQTTFDLLRGTHPAFQVADKKR